jgi:proliferating cell nuclear antigen
LIFGLQIENLFKILKCASNDDCIALSAEEEEPTHLKFLFENNKGDKVSEFNLNLVTLDSEQLGIPETEYSSIVTLPSGEFSRLCKELSAISETVQIETGKDAIKFSVNGEIGSGSVTLKSIESDKKEEQVILEVDEPVNLSFSLRFLNFFNKAASLSPSVTLSMSTDSPLVVEYKIENLGSLRFYLAPKINDEEVGQ